MGITVQEIIARLELFLKELQYWKECQPEKYNHSIESRIETMICELKGEEPEFMEDIKMLLKDENGNKLYPVAQHYMEGEGFYCNSGLDAMDLHKIHNIIGDGILDLTVDHPIKIMLLTEAEQMESEFNGSLYDGQSYKTAFLIANGKKVTDEDLNEDRDHEEHLTFEQAKEKYSHLLSEREDE